MDDIGLKVENIVAKGELHVLCNFFFCHYVFKKPSAAEASESVYMRERVKKCRKISRVSALFETCTSDIYNVSFFSSDLLKADDCCRNNDKQLKYLRLECKTLHENEILPIMKNSLLTRNVSKDIWK